MARQSGIIQYRGRLGETVGMKNGYTSGGQNFTRSYVAKPSNPQSDAQVANRAKILPAVLFRRQLSEVISRAFEGVKYGGPTTRKWMHYAMTEDWANIPQLDKDTTLAVPGKYLISRGSLPTIHVTPNWQSAKVVTNYVITESITPQTTIGEITTDLLANQSYLKEGDQLTVVMCLTNDGQDYFSYYVGSIYLDSASTETPINAAGILFTAEDGNLGIDLATFPAGMIVCAVACVLSREGTTSYQRSTQRMEVYDTLLASYFASTPKPAMKRSYQRTTGTRSTDWPYEGGDVPQTSGIRINVSVTPSAGGSATGGGRYDVGDTVTLRATPASGYSFDYWMSGSTRLSTSTTYTFTAEADMSIVAHFTEGEQP